MGQVEALKSTLEARELGAVAELEATAGVKPAGWASTQNFATAVAGGHKGTGPAVVRLAHAVCGCATTETGEELTAWTVRRLCCHADLIPVVLGGPSEVLDAGRTQRLVTPAIWKALVVRDRHCRLPGCTRPPVMTHARHLIHWADGGPTTLGHLRPASPHHPRPRTRRRTTRHRTTTTRRLAGCVRDRCIASRRGGAEVGRPRPRESGFMNSGVRGVILSKRWRLREGVTLAEVVTLVEEGVAPHYRKLSDQVVLGLEALEDGRVLAIQRWSDQAALDQATRGERFAEWWRDYQPILAAWDAALEFEEEWQTEALI